MDSLIAVLSLTEMGIKVELDVTMNVFPKYAVRNNCLYDCVTTVYREIIYSSGSPALVSAVVSVGRTSTLAPTTRVKLKYQRISSHVFLYLAQANKEKFKQKLICYRKLY